MNKFFGLFSLFFIAVTSAQKLQVQVYYESLCADSQAFVTQQLYPALSRGFKDYVDIKWIPFGKSSYQTLGPDVIFTCHHGPNECYGNKVQACAIQHIQVDSYQNEHTRESLILEYINCLMKMGKNFDDNMYPGKKCANELRLPNWPLIEECANSTEGSKLLQMYGELTQNLKPPLTSVPTVVFNNQKKPDSGKFALTDFGRTVCTEISEPKPQLCATYNGATGKNVLTPLMALLAFISIRAFA